jgi:DNA processing protein
VKPGQRQALIAWSAIAEPGDAVAGAVVDQLGAMEALHWLKSAMVQPERAVHALAPELDSRYRRLLLTAIDRWSRRWDLADGPHESRARSVGARVIVRHDDEWPRAVNDLGTVTPFALFVRGEARLDVLWARSTAVVGSRAATSYGAHMAAEVAQAVAGAGGTVISGGAFGIDIAAHRAALAMGARSVAVMAGGIDRLYPTANAPALTDLIRDGAVVSEVPPGFAPHRSRFLSRNRLIAAAGATVVVEAAARSGALSTARHAAELLRPVGAVPGAVTSASSTGCHDLIRDGAAVLIGCAADAVELMVSTPEWAQHAPVPHAAGKDKQGVFDFDDSHQRAVFDAASSRGCDVEALARRAGLDRQSTRVAAGALAARGLLEAHHGGWRKALIAPKKGTK